MKKCAFLFPGQGSQAVGMGKAFYEASPLAREIFHKADEVLGYEISRLCFEGPEEDLKLTRNTQPALLIVSTIAYRLLGLKPDIAAGHSLGEYSAQVAAGALSFEDAVLLVHKRGRYMQEAVPVGAGAMAAVIGLPYDQVRAGVEKVSEGTVQIANWNSEEQIVIAGDKEAVEKALAHLASARSVMLPVSAPFHCRLMQSAEDKLAADLDKVSFSDPEFPIITNVDAEMISTGEKARDALKRQVTRSVMWFSSMDVLKEQGVELCAELGAGKVLSGLMRRISRRWPQPPSVVNAEEPEGLEKVRSEMAG